MDYKFYVYYLIDPFDNVVFYVGKGYDNRMYEHEKEVRRGIIPHKNKHLYYKIKKILSLDRNIIYKKVFDNLDENTSLIKESEEIKRIGRLNLKSGPLCNLTNGGEGSTGLVYTDDMRKFRSMISMGEKNNMFGKNHKPSSIKRMSQKRRNRIWNFHHTKEHRENLKMNNPGGKATSIKICQLNGKNELIKIWDSISMAAKSLGCSKGNLYQSLKNKWFCKGYKWKIYE